MTFIFLLSIFVVLNQAGNGSDSVAPLFLAETERYDKGRFADFSHGYAAFWEVPFSVTSPRPSICVAATPM